MGWIRTGTDAGRWGEQRAAKYLKTQGFRVLGMRVRSGPRDEIDVVARRDDLILFVEVKTRRTEAFGRPIAAVDSRKRYAQSRAAVHFLKRCGFPPVYIRFDVIEVIGGPDQGVEEMRHIENAFPLDSRFRLPY